MKNSSKDFFASGCELQLCLRIANIAGADIPPPRTDESIRASRKARIKQLLDTGGVKDWYDQEARATGAKILTGRFVDAPHKEKSRWRAQELATYQDPSVFAAAADVDNTSLIDVILSQKRLPISCASMWWRHSPWVQRRSWFSFSLLTNMKRKLVATPSGTA